MKLSNLLKKQKHLKKSKAFTLVELIVVITIIAILGTIAFIALQGYTQNSRDSKRISDINSIQKSLEIYIAEKGTYPIPDNYENIIYSGSTAWIEGTIGDKVIKNLDKINKKPLDPLTGNEYTYSVTSGKTEYQIGAISEGGQMGYKLPINQTHAASKKEAKAMIRGNYNERFLKVQSGTLNWILALPSIIATDITTPEIQTILDNKKLVYNNYSNIPHSYNNYGYTMTGGFNYTNPNPLIYSGSTKTLADDNEEKLLFVDSLKEAYNGTILQLESNYQDIVNADTENNETGAINLINNFINTNVGGLKSGNFTLPITETPQTPPTIYNCTGTLVKANATITNNTGLTSTTNYQTTTPENKCYYLCNNGYIGDDCETLITYTVTFDATGGTGNTPTTKTIDYNTAAGTLPTPPTKIGYIFNGWFTEITGGEELLESTIINSNITYYAQWSANTNTVVFNGNGNTGGATANQTIASDTTANLTANGFTKTGYSFNGWSTTSTGTVDYPNQASYTMGTSSVNLYAVWIINNYTVTFDANGGTLGTTSVTATYNSAMPTLATAPTNAGYTFNGYYSAISGGTKYYNADKSSAKTYTLTTATTLYAQWIIPACTGVGQIKTSSTTYTGCNSADIIVCSGNGVGYIISSCNAGATVAGTGASSYGKYYQWGNNGGTVNGNLTPSTTLVNASSYGPGNYYSNTTFIGGASLASPYDWTSVQNNNLWGDITNTSIARQGPCAAGYHIPTEGDWAGIKLAGGWGSNGTNIMNSLKLPMAGYRNRSTGIMANSTTHGYYRSTSPNGSQSFALYFYSSFSTTTLTANRVNSYNIRCLKN